MPKWLRVIFWIIGSIILLVIGLWFALVFYIQSHKQEVLSYITEQVSEKIDGSLQISDMQPSFRTFPDVSVALKNVILRDTQYHIHHHSLLSVQTVYAKLHLLSLLQKRINLIKATASNGTFYIYVDSTGYSNAYMLKGKEKKKKTQKKGMKFSCHSFSFENVRIVMDEQKKQKLFNILARQADGFAEKKGKLWRTHIHLDAVFNSFAFNKDKGSFLKNAHVVTDLYTGYDPAEKKFFFKNQHLSIDNQPIIFSAMFLFGKPPNYYLHIHSETVPFKKVISWLSHNIETKLQPIDLANPMLLDGWIKGNIKYRDTPSVYVYWKTKDNTLNTPFVSLQHVSFSGHFENVTQQGAGHGDKNSSIVLHNAAANWYGIPVTADSVRLDNIQYPFLQTSFHTSFPLTKLNKVPDSQLPFSFSAGAAKIDVFYKGGVKSEDTLPPYVDGKVSITDGDLIYQPRGLHFKEVAAELLLKNDDLYVTKANVTAGGSTLLMKGDAAHFFRFYFSDPGKVNLNWQVTSPLIDIKDFMGFASARQSQKKQEDSSKGVSRMIDQLNTVLNQSNVNIQAQISKIQYSPFTATNFSGSASLRENIVTLNNVKMNHADGSVKLSGSIEPDKDKKPFNIKAELDKLQANKFFHAFNNFGQTTITDTNVNGLFTAKMQLTGRMDDSGKLMPHSLDGKIDFSLANGNLQNVKPLKTIASIFFRNRDFSDIRFQKISNTLNVHHEKILMPPMDIISSALYLHLQGVYSVTKGTDIAIDIPLRNPEKDGVDTAYLPKIPEKRGIVIHLRAHDDDEGKVKISWDPFKKGKKTTDTLNYKQ